MTAALFAPSQRSLTISCMALMASASYNNLSVGAALPAIGDSLGNLEFLPWVITVELITAAIAVLAIGPIIDSVGPRVVYRGVLVGFTVTSVLCAAAPTMLALIAARALQGLAAGAMIANVMAAIGLGVPPALRARAYAANSAVWGVMGVGGPAVAATVLTLFDWPAIFLINVPVAIAAGVVGWHAFPEGAGAGATARRVARPDRRGLVFVVVFTFLSLGALSTIAWWTPLVVLASFAAAYGYVRHERATTEPVLRIEHITSPTFRWLHVTALLVISSGIASHAFLPVYVKGARGATTGEAAFSVVFLTVGWTSGSFLASRLQDRHRGERVILAATTVLASAVGVAALAVGLRWPLAVVFAAYFFVGIGLGGAASSGLATLNLKAQAAVMGRVNSAHQFIRTLGFTYGAALGGAILFSVVAFRLGDADAVRELLGDDTTDLDVAGIEALEAGYTGATGAAFGVSVLGVLAALRLERLSRLTEEPGLVAAPQVEHTGEEPERS